MKLAHLLFVLAVVFMVCVGVLGWHYHLSRSLILFLVAVSIMIAVVWSALVRRYGTMAIFLMLAAAVMGMAYIAVKP